MAAVLVAPAAAVTIVPLPDSTAGAYNEWTQYLDLNAYDPNENAIAELIINVMPDTIVEFTLYDYSGPISGEINRTSTSPTSEIITYRLGDQTGGPYERSTWLPFTAISGKERFRIQYGVYDDGGRQLWMDQAMRPTWDTLSYNITDSIYRATISASQDAQVIINIAPWDDLNDAINQRVEGTPGNLLNLLWDLMGGVYLVISLGWYVFKTIFIDNLLLFAALYEAVGMCYAANKSRDIFQFFRKVANYNVAAFKAMYWLMEKMITILTRIINALNPLG